MLDRLHARIGDLWWYSAMIFIACRSGDVIQAFIGLWLVPKYVGPEELGAVLPLQQLSGFFTVPIAVIAVVFAKYVNLYATRGERGKVRSFIHDVILASAALFLVCIAAAYVLIPHFYSRLNIAAGSLTILVLASGFVGNLSSLFSSALQGLKKFKTMTVQNLVSAPIRLVTLLVAMPFRPLSGYLVGQTTPAASCGLLAALAIRKDLGDTPPDVSWRKDLPEIWRYLRPIAIYLGAGALCASINLTVCRQRLPEIESSAFYLLSRFAEITAYASTTMIVILFPMVSEAYEKGQNPKGMLIKSLVGTLVSTCVIVLAFLLFGQHLSGLCSDWAAYSQHFALLPAMALSAGVGSAINCVISFETACRNNSAMTFMWVSNLLFSAALVVLTGHNALRGLLPDALLDSLDQMPICRLDTFVYATLTYSALQLAVLLRPSSRSSSRMSKGLRPK